MNSIKTIVTVISICFFSNLFAQDADPLLLNYQLKGNIKVLGATLTLEKKLAETLTIYLETGLQSDFGLNYSRYPPSQSIKMISPLANTAIRYYYNLEKRKDKGKRIENNAANFWSLGLSHAFRPFDVPYENDRYGITTISPEWGIQRNAGQRFSLETALGLSIDHFQLDDKWFVGPGLSVKIGYIFSRSK